MKNKILSITSLLFITSCSNHLTSQSTLSSGKIDSALTNATDVKADDAEAKYAVAIRGQFMDPKLGTIKFLCTASFISENVLLTAAHCFKDPAYKYDVVLNQKIPQMILPSLKIRSIKIVDKKIHQGYVNGVLNIDGIKDDIALVKIEGSKPENYEILDIAENPPPINTPFTVQAIGYGGTSGIKDAYNNYPGYGVLRFADLTAMKYNPTKSYFLIDQTNGKGACNGDSGGPALIEQDDKKVILGIANTVFTADENGNDVTTEKSKDDDNYENCVHNARYLNVSYYKAWIKEKLAELNQ